MKSAGSKTSEMLPEYDFSQGVRGKYVQRYRAGTNFVVLSDDPDELVAADAVRLGNRRLPAKLRDLPQPEDPDNSVCRAVLEERAGDSD
ncbi:MAG TPA: hypothetical protein VGS22_30520 [Thermoanaerobaculia bacterium]|jgi:hypothetical protein|nr:hypothetical protein [Thermoanaerobaculia bacterium]